MNRIVVLSACLMAASTASADPIVTWQGAGSVRSSNADHSPVPPVGTAVSWTLSFDPSQQTATSTGSSPTPGCMTLPVSGSVTIGDYTFVTGGMASGFTHAQLPGSTCVPSGIFTEFSLPVAAPPDNPWPFSGSILILAYQDQLMRDAFPTTPTAPGASLFLTPVDRLGGPSFSASTTISAVVDQTPVPEPGSMTLFGLGLIAAYRRLRGRA